MPSLLAVLALAAAEPRLGRAPPALVPATLVLQVSDGWNSKNGSLSAVDLGRLRSSDNDRYFLRDREQLTLAFDPLVPLGASVSAIRVFVEHYEEPRVAPGDILWKLGYGSLTSPTVVATSAAPLRSGESAELRDLWSPGSLVPDANSLRLVLQNNALNDSTVLDRVQVEIDYTLASALPTVTSIPNPTAVLGLAYDYDADDRAEASGVALATWSVVSAPPGFSIHPTTGLVTWTPSLVGSTSITIRAANASVSATQQFVVAVVSTPFVPSTLFPSNSPSLVYCPPERLAAGAAKSQQRLNVFLPPGSPPLAGWPVVLNNRAGGGLASLPLTFLQNSGASAPLHAFVASGIAVVDFGVTGVGDGLGLFYPPGHPSGRYESFRPADDTPEKDAEWALQWLQTQSLFRLDRSRICVRGTSEGAILAIWAAMGPERARASGSAQVRASTRVKGVLALQPPVSIWAFDQSTAVGTHEVTHYERIDQPGVPAASFGQVAEGLQKDSSIMGFAFQTPAARANNEAQAICLLYSEPVKRVSGAPADMQLDGQGFPRLHGVLGQPFLHDSWAGYVFYKRLLGLSAASAAFHGLNSVFAIRDTSALAPPFNFHTRTYPGLLTGPEANAIAHEWVLRTLSR